MNADEVGSRADALQGVPDGVLPSVSASGKSDREVLGEL